VSTTLNEPRLGLNGHTERRGASVAPAAPTPLANAGPLGLSAFAITTFLLSMVNAGLIAKGAEPMVFGVALMVGGLAQVLAGMWEFRTGNTFAGTAFIAYGAFWLSFWALAQFYLADIPKADVADAVGLYLIAWGIFTAYMFVASFKTTRELNIVFGLLLLTFLALGFGEVVASTGLTKAGGYLGLLTAAAGAYTAMAEITNATFGRTVLPIHPLS
jgi:succinate-acetate transporter protein